MNTIKKKKILSFFYQHYCSLNKLLMFNPYILNFHPVNNKCRNIRNSAL